MSEDIAKNFKLPNINFIDIYIYLMIALWFSIMCVIADWANGSGYLSWEPRALFWAIIAIMYGTAYLQFHVFQGKKGGKFILTLCMIITAIPTGSYYELDLVKFFAVYVGFFAYNRVRKSRDKQKA